MIRRSRAPHIRAAALAAALLTASVAAAAAAPGVPQAQRLENGLEVVLLRDHTLPHVSVSLWVRSGSKHEIESSAGYAHFLEHLIQRGTPTSGPLEYRRLANRRGGALSVRSNYDRTYITLTGIAATLDDLLRAAADMAFRATLNDEQINQELAALNQEMRSYYDLPSSVAFLETMRHAFPSHPYQYAMLGNVRSIGTLKNSPLAAFHRNLYVPNNMALVVAGDFDPQQALTQVQAAFGKASRSATLPAPPGAPAGFAGHDDFEKRLNLREPWTTLSFVGPGYRHPDRAAFEIIARALGDPGGSAVLAALMRARAGTRAQVTYYGLEDAGMLYVALNPDTPELSYIAARAALEEIVSFKKYGLKEEDLKEHVARILIEKRLAAESLSGRAEGLGEAALMGGVRYYWDLPAAFQRLTPADIKRVAKTYLVIENLRLVILLPKAAQALSEESQKAFHETMNALGAAAEGAPPDFEAMLHPVSAAAQITPGAWGDPAGSAALAPPRRTVLANGLTVVVLEDRRHGLAAASLHLRAGSGDDPTAKEGLANLSLRALARAVAAPARSAAGRGPGPAAPPEVQLTRDYSEVRLFFEPAALQASLSSMAEALRHPRVNEETLDDLRQAARAAIDRAEDDPATTALELFRERVYYGHRYAHPAGGTPAGLAAITADDLIAFQNDHLRPSRAVLAVAGDVRPDEVVRLAASLFGDWGPPPGAPPGARDAGVEPADAPSSGPGSSPAAPAAGVPAASPANASARAGEYSRTVRAPQSIVLLGTPGSTLTHADFAALRMIGTALTLQAFEDLVFERRAAFSAIAVPEGLRDGGFLAIEIVSMNARRDEAVFDLQRLARRMTIAPLTERDLRDVGRMHAGTGIAAAQGVRALASTLSYREITGLGAATYMEEFTPRTPTAARLMDLATRYLSPESWIIVKVGPGTP